MTRRVGAAGSLVGVALILAFIAIGATTLGDYGITWDEGLGDLYFGDVYLEFFKSGCDPSRLPAPGWTEPGHWDDAGQPDIRRSPGHDSPLHHWPVSNIIVAAFGEIFDRRLHLLGPIEARHLGIIALAALALAATWTFAREVFGTGVAAASVLVLGSFPEFFGTAHNVAKDVGECAFYSWTIVAFYRAYTRRSLGWLACAAVAFGLALGTKLNAAFAIMTLALWMGAGAGMSIRRWWPRPDPRPAIGLVIVVVVGFAIFLGTWPWLWPDPIGRLTEHTRVFRDVARGGPEGWQLYPFREAFVRTPPILLAFVAVGAVALFAWPRAREQGRAVLLVILWLTVPLVRSALPGFRNYDGIRRYLEFLPAFAIVAGVGVGALGDAFAALLKGRARVAIVSGLALLAAAQSSWIDVRLHPHQTNYLNPWHGGLFPIDYLGSSYREATGWLNANAAPESSVAAPIASHLLEIVAPIWLRHDMWVLPLSVNPWSLASEPFSWPSRGKARYVILLNRPDWSYWMIVLLREYGREIHRIQIDGHPILFIFELVPEVFRPTTSPDSRR